MNSVYISGPMTGYPDLNKKAFDEAEKYLMARDDLGSVVNPIKLSESVERRFYLSDKSHYYACMKQDIVAIMDCNSVYMLKGWEHSKGAMLEHQVAVFFNKNIIYQ